MTECMLTDFLININRLAENATRSCTLLAVSGGVDSMVMANLYHRAGLQCAIAHCNFQLRGEAAELDAQLVRQIAQEYHFEYHEVSFETKKMAKLWRVSTQMAARKLRYEWFESLSEQFDYPWIATAHHGTDQVETILLNWVRGSGLRGLKGMPEVNGKIIRPLLFATREQILEYAEKQGLEWREDRSNQDDYYRRNRIRKHVVPVLKSINPKLEGTVAESVKILGGALQLQNRIIQDWKSEIWTETDGVASLSIEGIKKALVPDYQLYVLLEPFGFSTGQVKDIIIQLEGIPGKEFLSSTHRMVKDRDKLILTRRDNKVKVDPEVRVEVFPRWNDFTLTNDPMVAYFDAEKLEMPLTRRLWQPGDRFKPFGMNGKTKKVSDLLIDLKLSKIAKDRVTVIVDKKGEIIWVEGLRTSHTPRVTETTREIAMIKA